MTQANIEKQATKTQENVRSSFEMVTQLQEALDAASGKYTFLQQLRGYVADLCDMLQVAAHAPPSYRGPSDEALVPSSLVRLRRNARQSPWSCPASNSQLESPSPRLSSCALAAAK